MIASIKRRRKGIVLVLSDFRELPAAARQQMKNKELALELLTEIPCTCQSGRVGADGCPPLQGLAYGSTRKRRALFRANLGGTADAAHLS